jgi:hypothetical protein
LRTYAAMLAVLLGACGDDGNGGNAVVDSGVAQDAGPADAGSQVDPTVGTCETVDTDAGHLADADATPECNLSGFWAARQTTESLALSTPQWASNWYLLELTQEGSALSVKSHMDCGIAVQGTVTVQLSPQTTASLIPRNRQVGRKGQVTRAADGTCAVSLERFYSVRGVSETVYAPTPRSRAISLEALRAEQPLPPATMPSATEDWDDDGKPGITWVVSGILVGVRHTTQRDWTTYFTAPGYTVPANPDFPQDLTIRAAFAAEEVVYEADPPSLRQLSQPNCAAPHTLTLRFLGKTADDARAKEILRSDDAMTCANIRAALPAPKGLR